MGEISRYDIAIVGGGPVGLTLAASLLRFQPDLSVAIIDRRPFAVPSDARASALAAGVRRVLEAIGLWCLVADEATPIEHMRITDSGHGDRARPLFLSFDGDVAPGLPYAHMVPNTALMQALLGRLTGRVDLLGPVTVAGFSADAHSARVVLADGETIEAPLVVAADGAQSELRQMAGIGTIGHAYGQSGLVTTIAHAIDHHRTAWEHFRPAGPFASLPLAERRSSLVFTETSAEAERLKTLAPDELAGVIEAAMGSALGAVEIIGQVQVFPLRLQIARDFHADRLALIGDAAHVVHPIAGQGLNLGLKDVAALTELVISAMRLGRDHGSADVLSHYARWRRFDTALMALMTDALNRLFSNDVAPIRAARDLGVGIVDRLPTVKSALMRHAAAIGGGEPKLMRGLML
ncbi:MAG: FAD-dependent monooxygenase [Alphaproteobacteria bacterium]|nr:FAD-dependent monooxygenase [Alphaproteobacteria bacterium]